MDTDHDHSQEGDGAAAFQTETLPQRASETGAAAWRPSLWTHFRGAVAHLPRPQPAEPVGYFRSASIFAAKMKSASTKPSILCVQMVISTLPQVK